MPEITEYKISDLTTAAQVDEGDFVELSQENQNVSGGRISLKATILAIANKIANGINFTSALQTTDKTIVGAINEVAQGGGGSDVEVTPILTEGTKIATITVDDVDADIYGENTKEELEKLSTEKTATGNPVTLETVNGGMVKSCEVTMSPIQSGTGDPSPSNIRPISGWDGLELNVSDGETEGTDYSATFPDTIYGGSYDFVSGEGEETWGFLENLDQLTWIKTEVEGAPYFRTSISIPIDTSRRSELICSKYKGGVTPTDTITENNIVGVTLAGNSLRIRDTRYSDATTFRNSLTDCKIAYPLDTPTPFSTTPTPIPLNKGTNIISTDADRVEIKYSEIMTIDDVKALIDAEGGAIDYSTEEAEVPNFTFFGEKVYVKAFTFSNVNIGGTIALMPAPSYIGHIVKAWMYTTKESGAEFTSFPAVWVHEGNLYINPYYNSTAVTGKIVLYYTKTS